jgi:hypothetical protein
MRNKDRHTKKTKLGYTELATDRSTEAAGIVGPFEGSKARFCKYSRFNFFLINATNEQNN